MLRLKLLACKVLYREISFLSTNTETILDVTYIRQGLHNTPDKLRAVLQKEIDEIDAATNIYSYEPTLGLDFDAILLGYGLCSNAIAGLQSQKYKIVVPRAHDCITLFLGSKDVYKQYFDERHGGIYWYTGGWIENTPMPGRHRVDHLRETYIEKYGEENADFLMESEQNWLKEYKSCTYINWNELANNRHIAFTKECADYLEWRFESIEGDSRLLTDFIEGNWNNDDFLIIPPKNTIKQSFDHTILTY